MITITYNQHILEGIEHGSDFVYGTQRKTDLLIRTNEKIKEGDFIEVLFRDDSWTNVDMILYVNKCELLFSSDSWQHLEVKKITKKQEKELLK